MRLIRLIIELPPTARRFVLLFLDSLLVLFSFALFSIVNPNTLSYTVELNLITILLIALPLYVFSGQYKGILRYFTSREFYLIITRNLLVSLIFLLISSISKINIFTLKEIILLWLILTGNIAFSRVFFRDIIYSN